MSHQPCFRACRVEATAASWLRMSLASGSPAIAAAMRFARPCCLVAAFHAAARAFDSVLPGMPGDGSVLLPSLNLDIHVSCASCHSSVGLAAKFANDGGSPASFKPASCGQRASMLGKGPTIRGGSPASDPGFVHYTSWSESCARTSHAGVATGASPSSGEEGDPAGRRVCILDTFLLQARS